MSIRNSGHQPISFGSENTVGVEYDTETVRPLDSTELKPCPFCGGTELEQVVRYQRSWNGHPAGTPTNAWVRCVRCRVSGPGATGGPENNEIRCWNKRDGETFLHPTQENRHKRLVKHASGETVCLCPTCGAWHPANLDKLHQLADHIEEDHEIC